MLKRFSALALAIALVSATASARPEMKKGTTVDNFKRALEVATADPPPAQLINARMETKSDGSVVFGFYFYDKKTKMIFEREVSLTGSKVLKDMSKKNQKKDPKDEEVSKDMLELLEKKATGKSKLPEGRLLEIAGKMLKDTTIEEMKYEKNGDSLVMSFGDLKIDAETGKEIPKK